MCRSLSSIFSGVILLLKNINKNACCSKTRLLKTILLSHWSVPPLVLTQTLQWERYKMELTNTTTIHVIKIRPVRSCLLIISVIISKSYYNRLTDMRPEKHNNYYRPEESPGKFKNVVNVVMLMLFKA